MTIIFSLFTNQQVSLYIFGGIFCLLPTEIVIYIIKFFLHSESEYLFQQFRLRTFQDDKLKM